MTLGNAAAAQVGLIVWCKECQHRNEADPVEMATRYGRSQLARAATSRRGYF